MPWNELRKQRKENQFLKLCQTASQDSIALLDHNQNILWSNPHWADVSSRVGDIFTKELIGAMVHRKTKTFHMMDKQNPLSYWALSVKPLFSEEEQLNGYMLVLRDVSETKRYEAELIEQRDKLETLYQITPLALWTMNSSHTISNCNQTAKQYFKMIAQTFAMVFDSQERNFFTTTGQLTTFAELYNKVFYGGSPICNLIVQYEKRDRWLLINALCSGGSEVAFSAMDITPQILHSQELENQAKLLELESKNKSTLLLNTSNELKEAVSLLDDGVQAFKHINTEPDHDVYINRVSNSIKAVNQLLETIADYYSLDVNPVDLNLKWIDFDAVLSKSVASVQALYPNKNLSIYVSPEVSSLLKTDGSKLEQIFIHLFFYLLRVETDTSTTSIELTRDHQLLSIHVNHIDVSFFTDKTSLEFAVCRKQTLHLGGLIHFGERSFSIKIPVEFDTPYVLDLTRHQHVLMLDPYDDSNVLDVYTKPLDWTIHRVKTSQDLLSVLHTKHWDLLILYQNAQPIKGWHLAQALRELQDKEIPIWLLGSRAEQDWLEEQQLKHPPYSYFMKLPILRQDIQKAYQQTYTPVSETQMKLQGKTFLVVEDNPINQTVMRDLLTLHGAQVFSAHSGKEALFVLKNKLPDVILMDLNMPQMSGYECTQIIRNELHLHSIPIIAITANTHIYDKEVTLSAGFDAFIPKPLDINILLSYIRDLLMM